jgi:hypothetical protein
MLWNLVKGVVVLACEVAGIGVIPAALNVVASDHSRNHHCS